MSYRKQYRSKWISTITSCLVALGLLLSPVPILYAQDLGNGDVPPNVASETAADDTEYLWQSESIPFVLKPDAYVAAPDDVDKTEQFAHSLFLPGVRTDANAGTASVTAPIWRTIYTQNFEGSFPTSGWSIGDYNGPGVGTPVNSTATMVWDDNSSKPYSGYWSAHPNDATTYANLTDTYMMYGPINFVGALDAKFVFWFWLDSEVFYDYFSWEFSCNGYTNWTGGQSRSGAIKKWSPISVSLASCIGKTSAYIKFNFRSDNNTTATGVWVDDIRVLKYQ